MARENKASGIAGELFRHYPDYLLCRALAENILEGRLGKAEAIRQLALRARTEDQDSEAIAGKLAGYKIRVDGELVQVRSLSLKQILALDNASLEVIVRFYFKHPYAHGRIWRSRWIPRRLRTLFLNVLLGHARDRGLDLAYGRYFEMLRIL